MTRGDGVNGSLVMLVGAGGSASSGSTSAAAGSSTSAAGGSSTSAAGSGAVSIGTRHTRHSRGSSSTDVAFGMENVGGINFDGPRNIRIGFGGVADSNNEKPKIDQIIPNASGVVLQNHLDMQLITRDGDEIEVDLSIERSQHHGTNSIAGAAFNFINSIVGAGIIGMPFAMREAGFGFGIILIILMGVITAYSIKILIVCGLKIQKPNYQDLVQHCYGNIGLNLLSFGQFFFPFFGMIAYSIIIGQTFPKIFEATIGQGYLANRQVIITIMTLFLMLPLSMNKRIESLSRWSALALTGVLILIILVCVEGNVTAPPEDRGDPLIFFRPRFVQAIGVMAFAYVCHHNSFLIYESLTDASEKRFEIVNFSSVSIAAFLSIILGAGGSYAFGEQTKDNVLDNFDIGNTPANIARFFFAIAIMLTYPIECFVAREVIENYFFSGSQPPTDFRHYSITMAICLVVYLISLAVTDLGIILELNGIINANLIAFIIPGDTWFKGPRLWASLLLAFGIALFIFGIVLVAVEQS
eukprot:gene1128-4348_t